MRKEGIITIVRHQASSTLATSTFPGITLSETERDKINRTDLNAAGSILIDNRSFHYHHAGSFLETYREIFEKKIYQFQPLRKNPLIIDCGANMGLSVLFFSRYYPDARIIAFEPEQNIVDVLEKNIKSFELNQVELHTSAVWDEKTSLEFFTDGGMGGSVTNQYTEQKPVSIPTERLKDFLIERVDLLKMDIEGAELKVLLDCEPKLHLIDHLFIEYHSFRNQPQQLDVLLQLLNRNGFRYHLQESFSRKRPFIDVELACEHMDMAINVFAYRDALEQASFGTKNTTTSALPLVSICMPLYNGEAYLKKSLDACIAQDYPNLEILLVDDGSTDNTIELAKSYAAKDSRIRIEVNIQNLGLVGNWERCIELAKGDWIKFLFQDDEMNADAISKMMQACISQNVQIALCARRFLFEENADPKIKDSFTRILKKPEQLFLRKFRYEPLESSRILAAHPIENVLGEPICFLFHKSIYKDLGGFNHALKQMVDYEFFLKAVLKHPFVFLPEKLVQFRVHDGSTTSKNVVQGKKSNDADLRLIRNTEGEFIQMLQWYQENPSFSSIRMCWGDDRFELYEKYLFLRACRIRGAGKVRTALADIIMNSKHLKGYRYSYIRYKFIKRKYNRELKPFLNQHEGFYPNS